MRVNRGFPEVPPELVQTTQWVAERFQPAFTREPIRATEMRGFLGAIRQAVQKPSGRGKYWLLLGDNFGLTLPSSKGRCRDPRLFMLHRKAAAWALAARSRFICWWILSDLNPADWPSRKRGPPSLSPGGRAVATESSAVDRPSAGGPAPASCPREVRPPAVGQAAEDWASTGRGPSATGDSAS